MGNLRPWRRRLMALTPTEKRLQKRYRKATGTNMKVRLNLPAKLTGPGAGADQTKANKRKGKLS